MRNIIYILVSSVIMAITAFSANAETRCGDNTISSSDENGFFAYNAVNGTVEYLSEQNIFTLLSRNSSSQGFSRQLEARRLPFSPNRSLLIQGRFRLLASEQEACFQSSGALGSGTRSVSDMIYFFGTIII